LCDALAARREYRTSVYGEAGPPTPEVAAAWSEEFEPALNSFNRHLYPHLAAREWLASSA
jgi:hypothetical protein